MTKHSYDVHLWHHLILRHVMVRHIIVLMCHVCGIYVFVSSCKCYSRLVNVCHGFVPSWFWYFCHSNAFHAHACHAIVCHAIVTSCKCLSCNRGHVNERPTSASSCVPRWLPRLSGYSTRRLQWRGSPLRPRRGWPWPGWWGRGCQGSASNWQRWLSTILRARDLLPWTIQMYLLSSGIWCCVHASSSYLSFAGCEFQSTPLDSYSQALKLAPMEVS